MLTFDRYNRSTQQFALLYVAELQTLFGVSLPIRSFIYINIFYFSCMCAPVPAPPLLSISFLPAAGLSGAMCDFIYFRLHLLHHQTPRPKGSIKIFRMRIQICAGVSERYGLGARPSLKTVSLFSPGSHLVSPVFITLKDTHAGLGSLPLTPLLSCLEKLLQRTFIVYL